MRHSERQAFNNCPFKFHLQEQQLRKFELTEKAEDRTFGIVIHECLKMFYDGKGLDSMLAYWNSHYPMGKQYKSKAKDYQSGIELLKTYIPYWSEQDKNWEVLETELADVIEFNDESHSLHIDLVAKNKQTQEVWAWDHKVTEKYVGKTYFKAYELDSQITRYTAFIKDKFGSCGGFYVNAMQVGHRERMYKGEPAGYYQHFDRQPFSRNNQQIEFWKKSEADWMKMIEFCKKENVWPKHLGGLCGYCDYYELCLGSGDKNVMNSLYTTDPDRVTEDFAIIDESNN